MRTADRSATTPPPTAVAKPARTLPPWWIEVLLLAVGYVLYQGVQILVTGSQRSAVGRATSLFAFEGHLHLDPELWLDHVVAASHALVVVTGFYYGTLHFFVTPIVLIWLRIRRKKAYAPLRNTLLVASATALVVYWVLPLAPPRLSIPGIIDTLKVNDILSAASPSGPASLANQYAAMPSLHVAWATWVALAIVVSCPGTRLRHLAWGYPVATTLVVIGTGNHFLTDTMAGAALTIASWLLVTRIGTHGRSIPAPASTPTAPRQEDPLGSSPPTRSAYRS